MNNSPDEQLVQLYLGGDDQALDILVERYFRYVYNFAAKYIGDRKEAEDLTQETFLRVWRSLKKFDQQKNFKVWLFRVARNVCIDHLRRKKIPVFSSFENDFNESSVLDKIADPTDSVGKKMENQEMEKEMGEYLMKLSELNRSVLLLYYNQELTFREIADLLGESINTVKSRHRRALVLIRKMMI